MQEHSRHPRTERSGSKSISISEHACAAFSVALVLPSSNIGRRNLLGRARGVCIFEFGFGILRIRKLANDVLRIAFHPMRTQSVRLCIEFPK